MAEPSGDPSGDTERTSTEHTGTEHTGTEHTGAGAGPERTDQTRLLGGAGQASALWAAPDDPSGPTSTAQPGRRGGRQRPAWLPLLLVLLVVLAVAAPVALLSRAGARATASTVTLLPVPRLSTPSPDAGAPGSPNTGGLGGGTPDPNAPAVPSPDPSMPALIPTPPALARLGYRAVTLRSVTAQEVATDEGEVAEFRRDGLQSIANMELVGVNRPGGDFIASVYVLRFPDGASASRELAYSNKANRANGYRDVPVPGVAGATGLTKASSTGRPQVMDFTVRGSRQLFAGLRPVGGTPTVAAVGAEAARVLAALVLDSASITPPVVDPNSTPDPTSTPDPNSTAPSDPGLPMPDLPGLPSPTPTAQRA